MKIAIYETVHLDWVIPYAQLLAEEDLSIHFIISSEFKNDLENIIAQKNLKYTWHFLNPDVSPGKFSKQIFSIFKSNNYDLVVLNSVDSRHLIISIILMFFKPARILVNLHDIHNFFKIKRSISIRTNIRAVGKKSLMLLTDGYIVNAEAMKTYMIKKQFTQKPIFWLPPVFYEPPLRYKNPTSVHTIVVPGSIDKRRRNYHLTLQVIQEMLDRQVSVKWIFAGRPMEDYGAEIIEKAKELNAIGANILCYQEAIPENEFQQIIAACSLILSPLVSSTTIHDNIGEVYGESKGSGNVYDAIRHAKPLIIPSAVTVPKEIRSGCIIYQSKDNLAERLLEILTHDEVLYYYTLKAEENARIFSKERIKNMFKAALLEEAFT